MNLLEQIEPIDGWLAEPAALLTAHLIRMQDSIGIGGPMLEIGIHRGKFLALLRGLSNGLLVGIQLCEPRLQEWLEGEIRKNIERAFGRADPLRIVMADSTTLTTSDLAAITEGRIRVAHIDGGHDAKTAAHDLAMVEPLLRRDGLLIVDDCFNFAIPDVTEAICGHFASSRQLRPFAICYNKLFAAPADYYEQYFLAARFFAENEAPEGVRDRTKTRYKEYAIMGYKPVFFGSEIAIFV